MMIDIINLGTRSGPVQSSHLQAKTTARTKGRTLCLSLLLLMCARVEYFDIHLRRIPIQKHTTRTPTQISGDGA